MSVVIPDSNGEVVHADEPGALVKYGSPIGLDLPSGLDYEEWEAVGHALAHIDQGVQWWLGDWWAYGDHGYGDRAAQAADLGWNYSTFSNCGYTAGRIERSRRRESLSFAHHAEVASLEPSLADALLDEAEACGWNREQIRKAARALKGTESESEEGSAPVTRAPSSDWRKPVASLRKIIESMPREIDGTGLDRDEIRDLAAVRDMCRKTTQMLTVTIDRSRKP